MKKFCILFLLISNYCNAQIDGNCIGATYYTKLVPTGNDKRITSVCAACFTDDYFSILTPEYGLISFKIDQNSVTKYGGEYGVVLSFLNEEDNNVSKWYYQVSVYYGYPHSVTFTFTQQGTTIEIENSHWEGESDINKNTNTFDFYNSLNNTKTLNKSNNSCACGTKFHLGFDSVLQAIRIDKGLIKNVGDTIKFINVFGNPYYDWMELDNFDKNSDIQFGYSEKISALLDTTLFKGKKLDTVLELIPILNYDQTLRYLELDAHYIEPIVLNDGHRQEKYIPNSKPCNAFLITKYSKYRAAIEQVQNTLIAFNYKWSYTAARVSPDIASSQLKNFRIIAHPIFIRFPSSSYIVASHKANSKKGLNKK